MWLTTLQMLKATLEDDSMSLRFKSAWELFDSKSEQITVIFVKIIKRKFKKMYLTFLFFK